MFCSWGIVDKNITERFRYLNYLAMLWYIFDRNCSFWNQMLSSLSSNQEYYYLGAS